MDDQVADKVLDELKKQFPEHDVFHAWYCSSCEVFSKEVNEVSDDDGNCANCGDSTIVRIVAVA